MCVCNNFTNGNSNAIKYLIMIWYWCIAHGTRMIFKKKKKTTVSPLGCHLFRILTIRISCRSDFGFAFREPFCSAYLQISNWELVCKSTVVDGIVKRLRHFSKSISGTPVCTHSECESSERVCLCVFVFLCLFFIFVYCFFALLLPSLLYKCTHNFLFMCISFHDTCFCVLYKHVIYASLARQ